MKFRYTLAFIIRKDEVLMMNRVKQPWMGMWNGVGGKTNINEEPLDCIVREIEEETNIKLNSSQVIDKGIVTWNDEFVSEYSGMHIFYVKLEDDFIYNTPFKTEEGIIDFKKINWVNDKENIGVSYNIPYFLYNLINDSKRYHYHCIFKGNNLISVDYKEIYG